LFFTVEPDQAQIPTARAGTNGTHKILAKGVTSLIKVKTTFTLS
jgi:hypothetical protein